MQGDAVRLVGRIGAVDIVAGQHLRAGDGRPLPQPRQRCQVDCHIMGVVLVTVDEQNHAFASLLIPSGHRDREEP